MTSTVKDQQKIWEYFQGEGRSSFALARPRLDYILRQIASLSRGRSPTVLNVGCGDGYFELSAQSRGWSSASVDPDPAAIAALEAQHVDANVGFFSALPYANEHFDFVVASEVIEHLRDGDRAPSLREAWRVLKPDGWFLGTVPYNEELAAFTTVCPSCGARFHRWGHQASFTETRINTELREAGFTQISSRHTALVSWKGPLLSKLKALARLALARRGEPIAQPSLYFSAQKGTTPGQSSNSAPRGL